jgi:hypothetical protein
MPASAGGGKHALLGDAARSLLFCLLTVSALLPRLRSGLPAWSSEDSALSIMFKQSRLCRSTS